MRVEPLGMGLVPLLKMPQRVPHSFCHARAQPEVGSLQPRRRPPLEPVRLPLWSWTSTFRTISNRCLLLVDALSVGFCYSSPGD